MGQHEPYITNSLPCAQVVSFSYLPPEDNASPVGRQAKQRPRSTPSGARDCLRGDACEDLPLPRPRYIAEVWVAPGVVWNQELGTHIRVISIGRGEFAEGVMVPQAEEFAQVNIGPCGITADHEHVFVIVACRCVGKICRAGDHDRIGAEWIDQHILRMHVGHVTVQSACPFLEPLVETVDANEAAYGETIEGFPAEGVHGLFHRRRGSIVIEQTISQTVKGRFENWNERFIDAEGKSHAEHGFCGGGPFRVPIRELETGAKTEERHCAGRRLVTRVGRRGQLANLWTQNGGYRVLSQ